VLGRGGSVESRASATAIERDHAATTGAAVPTLVATEVLRRARAGDGPAGQVRDRALGALAEALGWVVTVADPDPIVLGGGLGEAGDDLLVPLAEALRRAVDWRPPPTLVAAAFGERAGWVGAALHGWELAGLDPDDLVVARAR